MDLREELLKEHSNRQRALILNFIGDNAQRMEELMYLFFNEGYRVNQRAAAVLGVLGEHNEPLVQPYLPQLVHHLNQPGLHDAVKRNTIRILQFVTLPEELYGITADLCFRFLASSYEPIAVKVFSMSVLEKICVTVPELSKELTILIEDQLPYASAGFKSRGNKILKRLRKR